MSKEFSLHGIELAKVENGRNVKQYELAIEVAAELGAKSVLSSIWTPDCNFYKEEQYLHKHSINIYLRENVIKIISINDRLYF